jgi:hypothetical protein
MNSTKALLDAVKSRYKLTSDYQLAAKLGMTRQAVSLYRSEARYLDDFTALKVAELLELPEIKVIAIANAERAKRPLEKARWKELAKASMLATALIGAGFLGAPGEVRAGTLNLPSYTLCESERRRRHA